LAWRTTTGEQPTTKRGYSNTTSPSTHRTEKPRTTTTHPETTSEREHINESTNRPFNVTFSENIIQRYDGQTVTAQESTGSSNRYTKEEGTRLQSITISEDINTSRKGQAEWEGNGEPTTERTGIRPRIGDIGQTSRILSIIGIEMSDYFNSELINTTINNDVTKSSINKGISTNNVRNESKDETYLQLPRDKKPFTYTSLQNIINKNKLAESEIVMRYGDIVSAYHDDDDELVSKIPPRTKKDLRIRRTRIHDAWTAIKAIGYDSIMISFLNNIRGVYDYITILNILWFTAILGTEWLNSISRMFNSGIEGILAVVKPINDKVKIAQDVEMNRFSYYELGAITGYRLPPYPGFDMTNEARDLAHGGNEFNFTDQYYEDIAREALSVIRTTGHTPRQIGFYEYIKDGQWATTGASDREKYTIIIDGEEIEISARKNMLPDILDIDETYLKCLKIRRQENRAFIKPELGKLRLVVIGDFYTYLQMSWLNIYINHRYKDWYASTIEETSIDMSNRMARMLELNSDEYFCLPYDFKQFDHQITLNHIKIMLNIVLDDAQESVSSENLLEFKYIRKIVVNNFDNSYLSWYDKGTRYEEKITGGLMSGLRWTSMIGNAWNMIMTKIVISILDKVRQASGLFRHIAVKNQAQYYVRGDDTAIYSKNPFYLQQMNVIYSKMNIIGSVGKYGLHKGQMEFLRIWYNNRANGYIARSIPNLSQRKGDSREPSDPRNIIKAIIDTIRTIRRRSTYREQADYDDKMTRISMIEKVVCTIWARKHNIPYEALSIPIAKGGLGLLNYSIPYIMNEEIKFQPDKILTIHFKMRSSEWREHIIRNKDSNYNELYNQVADNKLSQQDYIRIMDSKVHSERISILMGDDVPIVNSRINKAWKALTREKHFKIKRYSIDTKRTWLDRKIELDLPNARPGDVNVWLDHIKDWSNGFGEYKQEIDIINNYSMFVSQIKRLGVDSIKLMTVNEFIKYNYPVIYGFTIKYRHVNRVILLDWLAGKIQYIPIYYNTQFINILNTIIASKTNLGIKHNNLDLFIGLIGEYIEKQIMYTEYTCKLTLW